MSSRRSCALASFLTVVSLLFTTSQIVTIALTECGRQLIDGLKVLPQLVCLK